jgi:crotonobetainyl-CoA:carnitine CoA-transferase CaiB-like acyl-CoA transferase
VRSANQERETLPFASDEQGTLPIARQRKRWRRPSSRAERAIPFTATGPRPPIAEQGNTKDGWLFIMCNKEKFWTALAEAVGKPEWPRIRSIRRSQRV